MAEIYIDYATNTSEELEKQDWIDAKIDILYDMIILRRRKGGVSDLREFEVRTLLAQCESRYEMDTILHDVVRGNMSLNALLNKGIKCLKGGI